MSREINLFNRARSKRFTRLFLPMLLPLLLGTLVFLLPSGGAAKGDKTADFVGAKKCKTCHNKKRAGLQYKIWSESPHAHAFETLGSDKAIEVGKKLGIDNPQESGECLKCHSTAHNYSTELAANIAVRKKDGRPRITPEEGISCESCHGAGSRYMKKKIMKDHDLSVKAGMNPDPKKSCVNCHNSDSPGWNPKLYTLSDGTTAGFDFDQAWEKIKHMRPPKKVKSVTK